MAKFAKKTKEEIEALTAEQLAIYNEQLAKFEKEQSEKDDAAKKQKSANDDAEKEGKDNIKTKKVKAFQTSDKVDFWVKNDADNHARTLEDSSVKEVLIESK